VYDADSKDVVPPLPLRQNVDLPEMLRPVTEQAGVVEIVIGTDGTVQSAVIRQSFGATLDKFVQQSVNNWRYRAAARAGKPVPFRRFVRIILPGRRAGMSDGPVL
jgi:hypothetical protein